MFKSIMNFIRRLMAPKPGRCPKALDYNWSTQDGDGVRKHEATNTGSDPVAEMQAAVKPPKDEGEPRLVPDVKHVRKVKPAADAVTDIEPVTKKKPAKKTTAKKTTAKKTVKAVAENKADGVEKAAPAAKKAPAKKTAAKKVAVKKTVVKTEKKVEAAKAEEAVPGDEKTKKPGVKKATAKKTTEKKTVAKKPVAKKVAAEVSETKKEDMKAVPVLSETVLAKPQEEKPVEVAMTQAKPVKVRKASAKKTATKKALAEKTEAPVETIKETKAQVVVDTPAAPVATTEAAQAEPKPTEK